jgi:hypothetical protein
MPEDQQLRKPRGDWWPLITVIPLYWPIIKEIRKTIKKRRKHKGELA